MEKPITILIIEDDITVQTIVKQSLSKEGYEVLTADNGAQGLEQLERSRNTIKTVITDWVMPGLSGIQLLNTLKQVPKWKNIPVILTTSKCTSKDISEAIDHGAFQYLVKPFSRDVLLSMVRSAIASFDQLTELAQIPAERKYGPSEEQEYHKKLRLDLLTYQTMHDFFYQSYSCNDYRELTQALLNATTRFEFDSAKEPGQTDELKRLRCNVTLSGKESVHLAQGGIVSHVSHIILERVLQSGTIIQRGTYTAIPSKSKRTAILIRNTPQDPHERAQAIEIVSFLLERFEERLLHFESRMELIGTSITLKKINQDLLASKRELEEKSSALEEAFAELKRTQASLAEKTDDLEKKNLVLDRLSHKLAKYISPQLYASIFAGDQDVTLESRRKQLTIFFSDVKDFTELTDRLDPETLTYVLNDYLQEMSKIALQWGGTIDKFIGDSIMIFFGDPTTGGVKKDCIDCVCMALEMKEKMVELRQRWKNNGISRPFHVRMGINTGYCTVGNFGTEDRLDYTIIGANVNIASRLENACEIDQILISDATYNLVKDEVACKKDVEIKVKGVAYPIQTYKVIDLYSNIESQSYHLREEGGGFYLSLDYNRISAQDAAKILMILEKTKDKLAPLR